MSAVQPERAQTAKYDNIIKTIRHWPVPERIELIHALLDSLASDIESDSLRTRSATLERARGLLKTDKPAPSDEEVARWLEERRMEKYG